MESLSWQRFESVIVVQLVDWNRVISVQTMQEKQDFRQFLCGLVLPLFSVTYLHFQVFAFRQKVDLAVRDLKLAWPWTIRHAHRNLIAFFLVFQFG